MEDEKKYVENVEVVVTEVQVKTNQRNEQKVDKLTFVTDKGNITWKPKQEKSQFQGGLKVISTIPLEMDLLPKKLHKIGIACQEKGHCKMKVCYTLWETEVDGTKTIYRFITSEKQFQKWEIINEEPTQEVVE